MFATLLKNLEVQLPSIWIIEFKPLKQKTMSEQSEFSSRIDSTIDIIKRNNPALIQQLRVAKGVYESIDNEVRALIEEKNNEANRLLSEYNLVKGEDFTLGIM